MAAKNGLSTLTSWVTEGGPSEEEEVEKEAEEAVLRKFEDPANDSFHHRGVGNILWARTHSDAAIHIHGGAVVGDDYY